MFEENICSLSHKKLRQIRIGVKNRTLKSGNAAIRYRKAMLQNQDGHLNNNRLVSGKPYSWLSSIRQSCRAVKRVV